MPKNRLARKKNRKSKSFPKGWFSLACVAGVRGGGWEGKKEKKEGGKNGEGIGEGRKGTSAIINLFCSPLRTPASANSDWLIRQ